MIEDWKGQPSTTMTDYEVARIGYNNTVHGVPPTAEEVHNLACAYQSSKARLSEAVKVLEPFVSYLDEYRFDIDNNGNPLPDETRPGWTYLTAGDFRAAKAFLATIGEENE